MWFVVLLKGLVGFNYYSYSAAAPSDRGATGRESEDFAQQELVEKQATGKINFQIIQMSRASILFLFVALSAILQLKAQQTIRGYITDSLSGEPLAGAVVYFNATSLGTPANEEGYFELPKPEGLVSPLVVSFLGYEKIILQEPFPKQLMHIRMRPALTVLESVVLDTKTNLERQDPHRTKHFDSTFELGEQDWYVTFEKIFLGFGEAREETYISNREVLEFRYDKKDRIVTVSAKGPIIIENDYLKYRITYNLDTFWFQFGWNGERYLPSSYTSAGTSYFTDRLPQEETSRRKWKQTLKRRKEAFLGSSFHFMRALVQDELKPEGFEVFTIDSLTHEKKELKIQKIKEGRLTRVAPPEKFLVVYDSWHSNITAMQESFQVDEYGNIYPWDALKFEGYMGVLGMSSAVPLNFEPSAR